MPVQLLAENPQAKWLCLAIQAAVERQARGLYLALPDNEQLLTMAREREEAFAAPPPEPEALADDAERVAGVIDQATAQMAAFNQMATVGFLTEAGPVERDEGGIPQTFFRSIMQMLSELTARDACLLVELASGAQWHASLADPLTPESGCCRLDLSPAD